MSIKASSEEIRQFERAKQRLEENAVAFDDFLEKDGLSMLDDSNVIVLVNATEETGNHFVVDTLGLPPPRSPKVPKNLQRAVQLGAAWGLFVVPKDVFNGWALRTALDSRAPFGCCTVVVIEDAGAVLVAWSPEDRGTPQA